MMIEVWDYDTVSEDDLMCYCELDVVKECFPAYKQVYLTKEMIVAKRWCKQKKFRKKGKKPKITFYATYNKLF